MAIIDTLFDVLSASVGAVMGAVFAFYLNRKRNRNMASQQLITRRELERIKLENERLLSQIKEKENIILKMQMRILGANASEPKRSRKN
ncbi:MAG: hypothetical protein IKW67_00505 [Alphaproteobacteria bacterium]|nr:hypothetical protein [Alphaproteobacteria bacterium]